MKSDFDPYNTLMELVNWVNQADKLLVSSAKNQEEMAKIINDLNMRVLRLEEDRYLRERDQQSPM